MFSINQWQVGDPTKHSWLQKLFHYHLPSNWSWHMLTHSWDHVCMCSSFLFQSYPFTCAPPACYPTEVAYGLCVFGVRLGKGASCGTHASGNMENRRVLWKWIFKWCLLIMIWGIMVLWHLWSHQVASNGCHYRLSTWSGCKGERGV